MKEKSVFIIVYIIGVHGGLDDFGGDYGEYLNLLKGNSLMSEFTAGAAGGGGTKDIEKGQERQESVMGGGEFWTGSTELDGASKIMRMLPGSRTRLPPIGVGKNKDVHIHFDVNVMVNEAGKTKVEPRLKANVKDILGSKQRMKLIGGRLRQSGNPAGGAGNKFDWNKIQGVPGWTGGAGADGGQTSGWGGQQGGGGGQSGGPPQDQGGQGGAAPAPPPPSNGDGRSGRDLDKETYPKQMVVILHPELEVFHDISDKLDKAVEEKNRTAVEAVLKYLDKMGEEKAETSKVYGDLFSRSAAEESEERMKECGGQALSLLTSEDPWLLTGGLDGHMNSLELTGTSDFQVCRSTSRSFDLCSSEMNVTVSLKSGPNMPFRGRVTASYTNPYISVRVGSAEDTCSITSVKVKSDGIQFAPSYDSSIPINPWSQVSLSGYLVSRVKKMIGPQVERSLLFAFKESAK